MSSLVLSPKAYRSVACGGTFLSGSHSAFAVVRPHAEW